MPKSVLEASGEHLGGLGSKLGAPRDNLRASWQHFAPSMLQKCFQDACKMLLRCSQGDFEASKMLPRRFGGQNWKNNFLEMFSNVLIGNSMRVQYISIYAKS